MTKLTKNLLENRAIRTVSYLYDDEDEFFEFCLTVPSNSPGVTYLYGEYSAFYGNSYHSGQTIPVAYRLFGLVFLLTEYGVQRVDDLQYSIDGASFIYFPQPIASNYMELSGRYRSNFIEMLYRKKMPFEIMVADESTAAFKEAMGEKSFVLTDDTYYEMMLRFS